MRSHFKPTRMAIIKKLKKAITSIVEDVEKLKLSYAACGNEKWFSYFRKIWQLCIILNVKLPDYHMKPLIPKRNENRCWHKSIYGHVEGNIIYNIKKGETTDEWKNKCTTFTQ